MAKEAVLPNLELAATEARDALLATLGCRPQDSASDRFVVVSLELRHLLFARRPR